jgi:paraquat-inducible protein B
MKISSHVKLGVLALVAIGAAVATALALGLHAVGPATVEFHAYFDESVQGLELGSSIKYRGVRIGNVADIAIAPDRKHVDVVLALQRRDVDRLGLAATAPAVRAQLGNQGITGVKFIDIDFFAVSAEPAPKLPFEPAPNYLQTRPSLFKGLADNLEIVGERLPEFVDHADHVVGTLDRMLDELHEQSLVERVGAMADAGTSALREIRSTTHQLGGSKIGDHMAIALDHVIETLSRVDAVAARLDGERGLVASAHRATDSLSDLGREAVGSSEELQRTLRELGDAARAFRELVEAVDREPDMLLKGRARTGNP